MPKFRRKGRGKRGPVENTIQAPAYRKDQRAVEYDDLGQASRQDSRSEQAEEPPTAAPNASEFRPLPRCPRCGTAIGHDQKKCHGCDGKLKGI
jgi:hypothetical protein